MATVCCQQIPIRQHYFALNFFKFDIDLIPAKFKNENELKFYKDEYQKLGENASKLELDLMNKDYEINLLKQNLKTYRNQNDELRNFCLKSNQKIKDKEKP